ncbi:hypothetical protein ABPG72_019424 [Tetrahymena utriculariae]
MDNNKLKINEKEINRTLLSGDKSDIESFYIEQVSTGSTVWQATVNICKCGIGSTLLFMPQTFAAAGWLESILLLFLTGMMCLYSWGLLIKVLDNMDDGISHTLQTAAGKILGKKFQILAEVVTLIFNLGSILGCMIFILKALSSVFGDSLDSSYKGYVVLSILVIIYFPFSMNRHIEKLSYISSFGVFACNLAFITIIIDSIYIIYTNGIASSCGTVGSNIINFGQVPFYFGVIMFAFDINGIITDVHSSMIEKEKFGLILQRYMIFMISMAAAVGGIAYMAFGLPLKDGELIFTFMDNLSHFIDVLNVLYSLALLGSFLLCAFPMFRRFDQLCDHFIENNPIKFVSRSSFRLFFYVIIMTLAISWPKILDVVNLLGSLFSVTLGFIFPITLYQVFFKGLIPLYTQIINITILTLGIVGGACGVYSTLSSNFF